MQLFYLKCNEEIDILAVHECNSVDKNLHVYLSYHGLVIPIPQWFQYKHNCTLTKFSILENFVSYLNNNKDDRSK